MNNAENVQSKISIISIMYIYFISHHFNMNSVIKINYNHAIKSFNYINFLLINLYP